MERKYQFQLGIMALGILALGIMALGILPLGIMALGKLSCNHMSTYLSGDDLACKQDFYNSQKFTFLCWRVS